VPNLLRYITLVLGVLNFGDHTGKFIPFEDVIVKKTVKMNRSNRTILQSRSAILMCLAIAGCAATPVGPPPAAPGPTKMYCYAYPGSVLSVYITSGGHLSGDRFALIRDPGLDDHSSRPSGTPSESVAYSFEQQFQLTHTYNGDLEMETSFGTFEHVNGIDN
jgi:hypothetical protein